MVRMNNKRLGSWAASSSDPTEISNRVKGAVLALSSVIIFIAAQFLGLQLTASDVVALATQLGTVAGLVWGLWGAGLALVRWVATVRD
jgi:hypothetical protein